MHVLLFQNIKIMKIVMKSIGPVNTVHRGLQPLCGVLGHLRVPRRRTGPEERTFAKTGYFSLLYESYAKFIEDMFDRGTRCVTKFAKETGTEHCFMGSRLHIL